MKNRPALPIKNPSLSGRLAQIAMAIADYRIWDSRMIRKHGPLYYRALGLPVH